MKVTGGSAKSANLQKLLLLLLLLLLLFLPVAKPSGPRTVRVVVVGGGVVGGSSLSGHNIAIDMKLTTKLWLYEFTSGWDPD